MAQNIPIRLIHSDGAITQIMATDVALDVDRKTGGIALPFAGSKRIGFDFNMNNASIIINGIITDADAINTSSSAAASIAYVDFSVSHASASLTSTGPTTWIPTYLDALLLTGSPGIGTVGATPTTVELAKNGITLQDTAGEDYTIWFVGHTTVANQYGRDTGSTNDKEYFIVIYDTDDSTKGSHVDIADNFHDLINNDPVLQTKFAATKQSSPITNEANTQILVQQVTKGVSGDRDAPTYTSYNTDMREARMPYARIFRGGRGQGTADPQLSAGDKVMNLYGILNNSDNATILSRIQAIDRPSWAGGTGDRKKWHGGAHTTNDLALAAQDPRGNFGDYIIGIQIPYNSIYHAEVGEKYNVRNFFMPTGASIMPAQKSTANSEPADKTFFGHASTGDFSGIKGTVQKATFTRLGGEPIWSFTIIFAPIDMIM